MKTAIGLAICLLLGPLSSAASAQSQKDIAKNLAGMWRLVSNPQKLADGTTRQGANSVAYAFFDAAATHMCFTSMNPNRSKFGSENGPTPEEALSALRDSAPTAPSSKFTRKRGFSCGITRSTRTQTP